MKRLWYFLLGFITAFVVLFGSLFGAGYYFYTNGTIGWFADKTGINVGQYVDSNAQKDFSSMTIQQLVEDVAKTSGSFGNMSLNDLQNRYGIKLAKMLDDSFPMPDELFNVPLNQLATQQGINRVVDNTKFDYLFRLAPDLFGDVAKNQLKNKSFGMIRNGQFQQLLSGVQMGSFMQTPYDHNANQFVVADPNNPTLTEAISVADLGVLYDKITGNDADVLACVKYIVKDVKLKTVVTGLDGTLKEKTFGDLFVQKDGIVTFSADQLILGVYVGDILGYTPVYSADGTTIDFWKDKNGTKADNVFSALANVQINDLINGSLSYATIAKYAEGIYVGDLLGYTPVCNEDGTISGWKDKKGATVNNAICAVANVKVSRLLDGSLNYDNLAQQTEGVCVGDLLGYTAVYKADGVVVDYWKTADGTKTNNVITALANVKISDLLNGSLSYDTIAQYAQGVYVGDLLGYTAVYNANGTINFWKDKNGARADAIMSVVANIKVSDVIDGTITFDSLVQMFSDVKLGEVLGFKKVDGVWVDKNTNAQAQGILKVFADLNIGEMQGESLQNKIDTLKISDIMQCETGLMKALANSTINSLQNDVMQVKIGVILDYVYDQNTGLWTDKNGNVVSGIIGAVADLSPETLSTGVNQISIGTVLGMYQKDGVWYKDKDFTQKATGINAVLAKYTIGGETGISVALEQIKLGEIMGLYLGEDNKWYNDQQCTVLAEGLGASVADLSFGTFTADKIESIVKGLKIGDLFDTTGSKLFSLVPDDTTIENLPGAIENALEELTVNDAMDLGIVSLDSEAQTRLDGIFMPVGIEWKTLQLKDFLSALINAIPTIPMP